PGAQAPERAPGRLFAYSLRRLQLAEAARHGKPVIALHAPVVRLCNGQRRNRAGRASGLTDETQRVGQHLASRGSVEVAAVRVLESWIDIERGPFRAAGVIDPLFGRQ